MIKTFQSEEFGYEVIIGKYAQQADGAVWFKHGGTIVLATVVSAPSKEFPGFLPLTIDYREQLAAAGKIPGGYYKREGKTTDLEILSGRLIDRAIRPLFPYNFFDQIQILTTVYSVDKEHTPSSIALLASSLALGISKIPFLGPVGVVEVARVNGQWIMNPVYADTVKSDVRLIVAGTSEGISMVEGSANELSEREFIDILSQAHDEIKKLVAWQVSVIKEVGVPKEDPQNEHYHWQVWVDRVQDYLVDERVDNMYIEDKVERNVYLDSMKENFSTQYQEEITATKVPQDVIDYMFDYMLNHKITDLIFKKNKRIDGRSYDQIRNITTEVGLLPFTHGSALFTRGRTQALVSVTLGSGQDEQRVENLMENEPEQSTFMLHYNFPPFSVGEVRPVRGPGRREVGHGHLAASSFRFMLPTKEAFPYTLRIVADMLESDGSTSMATVCGSTMALMQGGVPIKKMVGGIAMGLLKSKDDKFAVLSDISGFEDAFGLMDFKVVGTEQGITAIQMDIKYKGGLKREVFEVALEQARKGRLHILGEMKKVMSAPNPQLSDLVPKVVMTKIDTDKIGAVIGTQGKTIREIIEVTKTNIDIEQTGLVKIYGTPEADINLALMWVKTLAGQIEPGATYEGRIARVVDFGIFIELVPGVQGLVHVSNIPREKQRTMVQDYKVDTKVKVQVMDYDDKAGRISLRLLS